MIGPIMVFCGFVLMSACSRLHSSPPDEAVAQPIIPVPKERTVEEGNLPLQDTLFFYAAQDELSPLYAVLKGELQSLYNIKLLPASTQSTARLLLALTDSLQQESYQVVIDEQIRITGGSYGGVAMGSISVLQAIQEENGVLLLQKGTIRDHPELGFRGLMVDVARRKHDIEVLKQLVSLCRWYKVNYMQLHLTDEHYFSFPSEAYPQLPTKGFHFTKDELADLVSFADARGVELIPELEVPGHAGQFVEQMPRLFGFSNEALNRFTINMARDTIYPVLNTLIGEIAEVFHSSEYIHIGGDEANFEGMDEDAEVRQYLQEKGLASVEELYWQFINRMNEFVKKRGRKAIVWEGFSKEANPLISKDITVMAWETMYQMPDELLDAGFDIINVSWKPLYVVNDKKWSPEDIYNWNVYQWQNWVPHIPSFYPVQLHEHPNVLGAGMASWDQPAYAEVSSLRMRLPAMMERIWNRQKQKSYQEFYAALQQLNTKLDKYFSPVSVREAGLRYPDIKDGRRQEQIWFGDTLRVEMSVPEGYVIRYSTDGEKVNTLSTVYREPLKLSGTTDIKYRAYTSAGEPVGHEILQYYELNPLEVELAGDTSIPMDSLWETVHSWYIPFEDSLVISITPLRKGQVRYVMGDSILDNRSRQYHQPIVVKEDMLVKAGLFIGDSLTGEPWVQHFRKGLE